jgi:hypothetical protein
MNHDDEYFHRAVAQWRERDGRYIPPALMNLALERGRVMRARAARDFFRGLVKRRRRRQHVRVVIIRPHRTA